MSRVGKNAMQRWLVPEVVQTSAMDCGPAALKCLLEGFNIPVSYGRLREACQTNVDGTSIDMLEEVANQLGVDAEQVMLPVDHIFLSEAAVLPAMVVVRHADGATHFVVIWRRHGSWLQVMDPAISQRLTALAHQYPAQRNSLLRLLEPLATPEELATTEPNENGAEDNAKSSPGVRIEMTAGNVFAAGHSILQDMNLTIAPGEHIAIVGPSGAGKSSIVGLLLGWHRLASGELLVDGLNLNGANQQALRQETAWVDPAVQLWNRSFLDNLCYSAGDSGFDHIASVIDAAALRGVLQKLPSGLQTHLGEGGAPLSGGEGQRVRLGRALLQTDVRLVLLDEPFRGMDRSQRRQLLNEASHWWQQATLLCVTHDVEETLSFNRVLVVEDGQIIEDDEPGQLAARDSRYRDLLNAEKLVRQELWKGNAWRRIYSY